MFGRGSSNLVPGDTNDSFDCFVKDCQTGAITRVSTDAAGGQSNEWAWSADPAISADGRFVVFANGASNLVPGDTNGTNDCFVKDCQTGAIVRVSTDAAGGQSNAWSANPAISADGRFVVFASVASNLVPGNTTGSQDVFRVTNPLWAVGIGPATFTLRENSPAATPVGTVIASGGTPALTYGITAGNLDPDGDTRLAFAIDAASGAITVNDPGDLDYETTPRFDLSVTVTDADGASDAAAVRIDLGNVDEPGNEPPVARTPPSPCPNEAPPAPPSAPSPPPTWMPATPGPMPSPPATPTPTATVSTPSPSTPPPAR